MENSCGAVIFRNNKYLLLKYGKGHWGFVKGNIEKNENEKDTFFREAFEETGLKRENLIIFDEFREKINYIYKKKRERIFKVVIYFLAKSDTSNITLSCEHSNHIWLDYHQALSTITYANDRMVLQKAHEFLKQKKFIK